MKALEPKHWHLNRIPRWSLRVDETIVDFYSFDLAYSVAVILNCVHTIQYKIA